MVRNGPPVDLLIKVNQYLAFHVELPVYIND
jgi:hypothetical protein